MLLTYQELRHENKEPKLFSVTLTECPNHMYNFSSAKKEKMREGKEV